MNGTCRIVVADQERTAYGSYQQALVALGHQLVGTATTSLELVQLCADLQPDLVLSALPTDGEVQTAVDQVSRCRPTPFLLMAAADAAPTETAYVHDAVLGCLLKPLVPMQLQAMLPIALHQFRRSQQYQHELAELRQSLQDRKVIERAKGILMKHAGLCEEDAFRRLQKLSWDKNEKLVNIAQLIITAEQALEVAKNPVPEDSHSGKPARKPQRKLRLPTSGLTVPEL